MSFAKSRLAAHLRVIGTAIVCGLGVYAVVMAIKFLAAAARSQFG